MIQFIKLKSLVLFLLITCVVKGQDKLADADLIKLDFKAIASTKKGLLQKDTGLVRACEQLLKGADKLLKFKPVSVMNKTEIPPSGDKHDFMSLAPYWWPDSSKVDGLPYIRKDGITNPEVKNYPDKNNMPKLMANVYYLALAYYYSNDENYAKHASKLISVWFLDTATRMNPNLNFGQAIKGLNKGRSAGIIDSRHFILVIDAINLLGSSSHWTKKQQVGVQLWFADYLNWLNTSDIGLEEQAAKNNHGVWYDAQALSMAVFCQNNKEAKKIIARAMNRLDQQMDKNGFFPLEMARTISLHYSVFQLDAFFTIAELSESIGVDFWSLKTKSNKSLQIGFDAILPYISKEKTWFGQQIKPFEYSDAYSLFIRGASKLKCANCKNHLMKVAGLDNVIYRLQ